MHYYFDECLGCYGRSGRNIVRHRNLDLSVSHHHLQPHSELHPLNLTNLYTKDIIKLAMKLLSVLALGFAASTVTARATQAPLAEDVLDVPGDNPLKYCALPDDNILEIESVDLSPNPPSA